MPPQSGSPGNELPVAVGKERLAVQVSQEGKEVKDRCLVMKLLADGQVVIRSIVNGWDYVARPEELVIIGGFNG